MGGGIPDTVTTNIAIVCSGVGLGHIAHRGGLRRTVSFPRGN